MALSRLVRRDSREGASRTRATVFAAAALTIPLALDAAQAQPAPRFLLCDDDAACIAASQEIEPQLRPARRGDYQAMRNIAFCMWDGCDGAVEIDRKGSCAWRRRIARLKRADRNDETHYARCVATGN